MGFLPDVGQEIRDIARRRERERQAEQIASRITPEQAAAIGRIGRWMPWVPDGVALGLGQAGFDADSPEVDEVSRQLIVDRARTALGWAQPGDTIRPQAVTQAQKDAAREEFAARIRAGGSGLGVGELAGAVTGGAADLVLPGNPVQRRATQLGGAIDETARDNPVTNRVLEPVARHTITGENPVARNVRGAVRTTVAALDSPRQYAQAEYRTMMENIRRHGVIGAMDPRNALAQHFGATQQVDINRIVAGEDPGEGFFVGAESEVAKNRRAAELTHGGYMLIEGRKVPHSIGRDFADVFFEPGSQEFNVLSGIGDAAVAIGTDMPLSSIQAARGASRAFRSAQQATEATTSTGRLLESIGAIAHGPRPTYSPGLVDAWLSSGTGRRVTERIAETTSISQLDAMTRRQLSPQMLTALAESTDPQDIADVLRGTLGLSLREAPISHLGGRVGNLGLTVKDIAPKPLGRWASKLPTRGYVDLEDPRAVLTEVERRLTNVNAPRETIDRFMTEMAQAEGRVSRAAVFRNLEADTQRRVIEELGGTPGRARELTRLYTEHLDGQTLYNINGIGDPVTTFGAVVDGVIVNGPEPHLLTEHVGRFMPGVDVRAQRRAFSSPWVKAIIGDETLRAPLSATLALQENVWKPSALLRPAFPIRVIGEEQARMAAAGLTSAFRHPISYIGFLLGDQGRVSRLLDRFGIEGKGATDVFGAIAKDLDEHGAAMARGVPGFLDDEKKLAGMAVFRRGEDGFADALADELATLAADPVAQMVSRVYAGPVARDAIPVGASAATDVAAGTRALGMGNPLLEAQDRFWNEFRHIREELAAAHPNAWTDVLTRQGADRYVESVAHRITEKTRDIPELLDAVRTGRINGVQMFEPGTPFMSRAAVGEIGKYIDVGPEVVRGPRYTKVRNPRDSFAGLNRGVDSLFAHLFTKPDNYLSRSPAWRQFYIDHTIALAPKLDASETEKLLAWAARNGVSDADVKTLRTLTGTATGERPLSLDALNDLARGHALDDTKKLLFDLSERGQFFDTFRLIFPFGEAWGEMVTRWGKLLATRPKNLLTIKRVLEGGRSPVVGDLVGAPEGKGAFYRDEFGEERFQYPLTGQLLALVGLPEVPLTGRLQGLTLGTEVIPGVGPVAQLPLAALIPDEPAWDPLTKLIFPFGRPDKPGDPLSALDEMLPAWARTLTRGGTQGGVTSEGQRAYANTTMDVVRYLASTGDYQISGNPNSGAEITRMLDDAKSKATWLTLIRGMAQSSAPSSPTYEWYITDPNGQKLPMLTLVADYRAMQEEDFETSTQRFLAKYGDNAFLLMQGKSVSVSSGILPPTTEANDWLRDNGWAQKSFPSTYGFFAPQGGEFSSQAYQRQLELQERRPLTPEQFVRAGNDMIAKSIYYAKRDEAMASAKAAGRNSLTDEQQAYMRGLDEQLRADYEGYGDEAGKLGRATPEEMIDELGRAIDDQRLSDTPMAGTIREYLTQRDRIRAASVENFDSENSYQSAAGAQPYRQYLEQVATTLIDENPDFALVWERVFRAEMNEGIRKDTGGEEE